MQNKILFVFSQPNYHRPEQNIKIPLIYWVIKCEPYRICRCVFVCVWRQKFTDMCISTQRSEVSCKHLPLSKYTLLFGTRSLTETGTHQLCLTGYQQAPGVCLTTCHEHQGYRICHYVGAGNPDSRLQVCISCTFHTEPSFPAQNMYFIKFQQLA